MPTEVAKDLNCVFTRWHAGLERLPHLRWTVLFVGVVNNDGRPHSRRTVVNDADFDTWRTRLGESNMPMAEKGLAGLWEL